MFLWMKTDEAECEKRLKTEWINELFLDTRTTVTKLLKTHVSKNKVELLNHKVSIQMSIRQFKFIKHAVIAWYKNNDDEIVYDACISK